MRHTGPCGDRAWLVGRKRRDKSVPSTEKAVEAFRDGKPDWENSRQAEGEAVESRRRDGRGWAVNPAALPHLRSNRKQSWPCHSLLLGINTAESFRSASSVHQPLATPLHGSYHKGWSHRVTRGQEATAPPLSLTSDPPTLFHSSGLSEHIWAKAHMW